MAGRAESLKKLKAELAAAPRSGDGDGNGDGDGCSRKVLKILKVIIRNEREAVKETRPVSMSEVRGAIQLVIERLDSLSTGYLSHVLDLLVADIRYSCSAFDVLETSLSMIVHSSANFAVDVDGDEVEMSGQEYRDLLVARMLEQEWDGSIAPQVVSLFRNSPITAQQGEDAACKVLSMISQVDAQSIPPLMYQLLLLASKLGRASVFQAILEFCIGNTLSRSHPEKHRELEGTLIVHLLYTAQRDHKIGVEIFRHLRSLMGGRIPHFALALALAFANTSSFEASALDFLRKHVSAILENEMTLSCVSWLWKLDFLSCSLSEFRASLIQVLAAYAPLTDGIAQGIVSFLLHLLSNKSVVVKYLQGDASTLLVELIQVTFGTLVDDFRPLRQQVVEKLLRGAVDAYPWNFSIYARVLGGVLSERTEVMEPFALKCKEALESVAYQRPQNIFLMLRAVLPVLKNRADFRDNCLIFARKLILWKDAEVQKAIISSLIELLKSSTRGGEGEMWAEASSSQVSFSSLPESNAKLCKSIKVLCRKAVSQSPAARSHLYSELAAVCPGQASLERHVVDLLWSHSQRYWEAGRSADQRLGLSKCFRPQRGTIMLEEPVADLIAVLSVVLGLDATAAADSDALSTSAFFREQRANLQTILVSSVSWFSGQNIDTLLAFGDESSDTRRFRISADAALQVLRVADACIGAVLREGGLAREERVSRVERLFFVREGLEQWLVGNSKALESEKDVRKISSMIPHFDPKTLGRLTDLFADLGDDGVKIDSAFHEFILVSLERLIREWSKVDPSKLCSDDIVRASLNAFRYYMREAPAEWESGGAVGEDEGRGPGQGAEGNGRRDILLKSLTCVELVLGQCGSRREEFVRLLLARFADTALEQETGEATTSTAGGDGRDSSARWVDDILELIFQCSLDRRRLKEYELLAAILGFTIQFVSSAQRKRSGDKFLEILTSAKGPSQAFVRASVVGCLHAYEREDAIKTCRAMARSLVDEDKSEELISAGDDSITLAQLHKYPASEVLREVFSAAENTAAVVKRSRSTAGPSHDEQALESQEDSLMLQQDMLFECVVALSDSMASILQKKQTSDALVLLSLECSLKLTRVYSAITKIYMVSKNQLAIRPPDHFSQLVKTVGDTFIEAFYSYIHYQQNKGGNLKASKNRKIGKLVPEIIFEIEEYEKLVLILGKLAKVDYMHCIRKSICRDFRFNFEKLAGNGGPASNSEQDENCDTDTRPRQDDPHEECDDEQETDGSRAVRMDSDGAPSENENEEEKEHHERTQTTWNMPDGETSQGTVTEVLPGRRQRYQPDGKENQQPKKKKKKTMTKAKRGEKKTAAQWARRAASMYVEDEASNSDGDDTNYGEDEEEAEDCEHSQGEDFPLSGFDF